MKNTASDWKMVREHNEIIFVMLILKVNQIFYFIQQILPGLQSKVEGKRPITPLKMAGIPREATKN